jgi:hypothetical protein
LGLGENARRMDGFEISNWEAPAARACLKREEEGFASGRF